MARWYRMVLLGTALLAVASIMVGCNDDGNDPEDCDSCTSEANYEIASCLASCDAECAVGDIPCFDACDDRCDGCGRDLGCFVCDNNCVDPAMQRCASPFAPTVCDDGVY